MMKFGISVKLFLAIFATCMLVLLTMHWGVRVSFERSFIDYIRQGNEQRVIQLRDGLEEQYALYGDWGFLRDNEKLVFKLLHASEQNDDDNNALRGWRVKLWVLDAQKDRLFGSPAPISTQSSWQAIRHHGEVVGWVVASSSERLTRDADINFDRQQQRTSWLIAALSALLAVIATWLTSRGLLAPVKRLMQGIHRLAAGEFTARVHVNSRDELGRLAQDFNQLASALEKNEESRRAFMADISHELRTPLAVLRGELEAIQDGVRKPDTASLLSLQNEVSTLTKLVDDLHQLSLSDVGALAYRKVPIDLIQLLQISIAAFNERFQKKQIVVTQQLPIRAASFGDPDRLSQLFNNLLENSLRYTDSGGTLRIHASNDNGHCVILWEDSAPGVDDEQLTHIFDRFYRAERSRNRASGGSGLGLAICKNIVEAHGGELYAKPSPLGGVQMTVVFVLQPLEP